MSLLRASQREVGAGDQGQKETEKGRQRERQSLPCGRKVDFLLQMAISCAVGWVSVSFCVSPSLYLSLFAFFSPGLSERLFSFLLP